VKTFSECVLGKRDCFRVNCDYRLLNNASNPLPVMNATQNKSDVTSRFGDRDFILAVCTCFLRKCGRFEVMRDFRSLNHGGIPFRVDGSTAEQSDVTIQFLVGDLVIHNAGVFHLSFSVQKLFKNFMLVQW
jgi:hypothetical protein